VRFVGGYPFGHYYLGHSLFMSKQSAMAGGIINDHCYLFTTSGSSIIIFNIDNPSEPIKISHILSPIRLYPFLVDTILYTTAIDRGLKIYNVSDPANSVEIGICECSIWMWSVFVKDSLAYATGPNQLTIFNVSDPTNPFIIGTWTPAPSDAELMYISVQGNYAYITAERSYPNFEGVLFVVDVSNPVNPFLVGTCGDMGNVRKVKVGGDYAYVVSHMELQIVDVSDPMNPCLAGACYGQYFSDVFLSGRYAFCSTEIGIKIFDIYDPLTPFLVSSTFDEISEAITLLDSIAYLIVDDGLSVFNVAEPLLPFKIGDYSMLIDISRIKISDTLAIVSSYEEPTIGTINIADPLNCSEMAKFKINHYYDTWIPEIDVQENYVYATALDSGLRVLDISDPANIIEAGHCIMPGSWIPMVSDVFVQNNYAYVASSYDYEFSVVDISDPSNPYAISGIPSAGTLYIYNIFVVGDYAYCAADDGLIIIDVSDPYNPYSVGKCSVSTYCGRIFVSGNHAYLKDYPNQCLWIMDISNPYNPFVVNQYPDIDIGGIFVSGNYLFLGSRQVSPHGLRILDVSDPANYQEVGYYWTPFMWVDDITVVEDYIYLATYDTGLWILQYYNIGISEKYTQLELEKLKLNTIGHKIKFSYILNQKSSVKISLIDICGRIIENIVTNEYAGIYTKEIRNTDIPSGIYFLKIETNEWNSIKKIILLK